MNVKLIGVTAPYAGHNSAEDLIVHMARVSNPSNQNMTRGDEKLIRYLIKNQHWSPFEMVNVVMEINTTRDIARQILRHRSFSFQEFSQRYADPTKDPAYVRDLIVLIKGPDKGRTGIVIGIYPDGSNTCVVKLDRYRGIREIRIVNRMWAAKRLGEQAPDDVFFAS